MTEFKSLSEKVFYVGGDFFAKAKDVREFIRLSIDNIFLPKDCDVGTALRLFIERMKKLAGPELTQTSDEKTCANCGHKKEYHTGKDNWVKNSTSCHLCKCRHPI